MLEYCPRNYRIFRPSYGYFSSCRERKHLGRRWEWSYVRVVVLTYGYKLSAAVADSTSW